MKPLRTLITLLLLAALAASVFAGVAVANGTATAGAPEAFSAVIQIHRMQDPVPARTPSSSSDADSLAAMLEEAPAHDIPALHAMLVSPRAI